MPESQKEVARVKFRFLKLFFITLGILLIGSSLVLIFRFLKS